MLQKDNVEIVFIFRYINSNIIYLNISLSKISFLYTGKFATRIDIHVIS